MTLLTQPDFDSKAGQTRIITEIHRLERKVHDLEQSVRKLDQTETALERDQKSPEAY
jgi:exonuclease VII small subunit